MEYGVPQGSILGPLLFIIYINDLPNISDIAKFILYADDANIFINGSNMEDIANKLQHFCHILLEWVDVNGLVLNLKKTQYIIFSKRTVQTNYELLIAGKKIERKTEARFLGVIIDEKLNWSRHIATIKTKMARYVGIMYKLKNHLPLQARLQIYHSFVQSHLNYCSLIWGFASKSLIEGIFRKQKMGLRAVIPGYINYRYRDGEPPAHTKASFKTYDILTIHSIIVKNALIFMHKIRHFPNMLPISVKNTIADNAPIIAGSNHEDNNSWYESYGITSYKSTVFYKGPLLAISEHNTTATTLASLISLNVYKREVKCLLTDLQNQGGGEEWPNFLLYNIPGLRRSQRMRN